MQKNELKSQQLLEMNEVPQYAQSRYRIVIATIFSLCSVCSAFVWLTVSPISVQIKRYYSVSSTYVTSCTMTYMWIFLFITFESQFLIDNYPYIAIVLGMALTFSGAFVRIFLNQGRFWLVLLGGFIAGAGQPFIINSPAKISGTWFTEKWRVIMTAILTTINPLGSGLGFIMPALFVADDDSTTIEEGQNQTKNLMICQAAICGAVLILAVILFRNKPKNPPNAAEDQDKIEFKKGIVILFTNKQFWLILVSFSLLFGNFNTYATIIDLVIDPFDFGSTQSAVCGALIVVAGILSSIINGLLVDKTRKYKMFYQINGLISTISLGLLIGSMYTKKAILLYIAAFLYGFGSMSLLPITFEFGCESFFPLGEALITGCFLCSGQIIGSAQIFLYTEWLENNDESSSLYINLVLIGCGIFAMILSLFFKQDLKRSQFYNELNQVNNNKNGNGITNGGSKVSNDETDNQVH